MKKRVLSIFLLLALLLTLVGCGNKEAAKAPTVTSADTTTTATLAIDDTTSIEDRATVDAAFALAEGESLPDEVTLTGEVSHVKEVSSNYQNATFDLQVEGSAGTQTLYCYRVKPAEGNPLTIAVGDTVTLTGTIQNYRGTIEFYPATYVNLSGGGTTAPTTKPTKWEGTVTEDGIYDGKDQVALYLHTYGKLPQNYVTKSQHNAMGEPTDKCCGGDRFYNKEGLLPNKAGRLYYECDIDTLGSSSRGQKRIVYSNDGLVYYTGDHYRSFTLLYGEP